MPATDAVEKIWNQRGERSLFQWGGSHRRARQVLQESLLRTQTGTKGMLLLSGPPGVGKAQLLRAFREQANTQGAAFFYGHTTPLGLNLPHAPLLGPLHAFLSGLPQDAAKRDWWQAQAQATIGDRVGALFGLLPVLSSLVEASGALPSGQDDTMTRAAWFKPALTRLLDLSRAPEQPLLLCIEGLHNLDGSSLGLLHYLLASSEMSHVLLIGTAPEEPKSHTLQTFQQRLAAADIAATTITLQPLTRHELKSWCQLHFDESPERLAQSLYESSHGLPLVCQSLLQEGHHAGWLRRPEENLWDERPLPAEGQEQQSIISMYANWLGQLPLLTQELLHIGACQGGSFNCKDLSTLSQQPLQDVEDAIQEARRMGFVTPVPPATNQIKVDLHQAVMASSETLCFAHEFVLQAAYQLRDEAQRQALHWQIGQWMDTQSVSAHPLMCTEQLNLGVESVEGDEVKLSLCLRNLEAGLQAKEAGAFDAALRFFCQGIVLLPDTAQQSHAKQWRVLHLEAADAAHLSGDHDFADTLVASGLEMATSAAAKAAFKRIQILALAASGDAPRAEQACRNGMSLYDQALPESGEWRRMYNEQQSAIRSTLRGKTKEDLLAMPVLQEGEAYTCLRLLGAWLPSLVLANEWDKASWAAARMVFLTCEHGRVDDSAYAFLIYGLAQAKHSNDPTAGTHALRFGEWGQALHEASGSFVQTPRVLGTLAAHPLPWRLSLRETLPLLEQSQEVGEFVGDLPFAKMAAVYRCHHTLLSGTPLEELHVVLQSLLALGATHPDDDLQAFCTTYQHIADRLAGFGSIQLQALGEESEHSFAQAPSLKTLQHLALSHMHLLLKEYPQAREQALAAAPGLALMPGTHAHIEQAFNKVLAATALSYDLPPVKRLDILTELENQQRQLGHWAQSQTTSVHKAQLLEAELSQLRQRDAQGTTAYEAAMNAANRSECYQEEAQICEFASAFHHKQGHARMAGLYLQMACERYAYWGAHQKADQLKRALDQMETFVIPSPAEEREVLSEEALGKEPDELSIEGYMPQAQLMTLPVSSALEDFQHSEHETIEISSLPSTPPVPPAPQVQQEAHQALQASYEAAREALSTLAHNTAHALRTSLRGLQLTAHLGLSTASDPQATTHTLTQIEALGAHMASQLDGLLSLAKSAQPLVQEEIALKALLPSLLTTLQAQLAQAQASVELEVELPSVRGVPSLMMEVFRELISNAIRFNDMPNKQVEIGVKGYNQAGTEVELYVRDNGIGIPQEQQGLVWELFTRLHSGLSYGEGAGVGLALVKAWVEAQEGSIQLVSDPGKGTSLMLTFQVA